MTVRIIPRPPVTETTRPVSAHRFLFELHSREQRLRLMAAEQASRLLSDSELLSEDPTRMTTDAYPVMALQGIREGYFQMGTLEMLDLLSADMAGFFVAEAACGVFGDEEAVIAAEIERIKSNTDP